MRAIVNIRRHWATPLSGVLLGLLLLLPASPHAAEFVLCLESTGQVNVEHAEANTCSEPPKSAAHSEKTDAFTSAESEHCPGCSDVPLQLTEADDPCGTAITPSIVTLDAPGEQLSLSSTRPAENPFAAVEGSDRSHPQASTSPPSVTGPDASLGSVVLLI